MNTEPRYIILIAVAGLGLLKALWGVIGPGAMKRFVRWWRDAGTAFHKVVGAVCVVVSGLLLAVVLMQHQWVDWLLMLFAVALAWGGNLYFREEDLKRLIDVVILKRGDIAIRVISVFSAALCGVLVWIALTGMLRR